MSDEIDPCFYLKCYGFYEEIKRDNLFSNGIDLGLNGIHLGIFKSIYGIDRGIK